MELVVNEWLPEYFRPDASNEEKQELERFLNRFMERNDKIFVRRPSRFLSKIEKFSKLFQWNNKVYQEIKKFHTNVLLNSDRCFLVDDGEFELSEVVRNKLVEGGNTVSDTYLFEAASATETKLIITTDVKLHDLMKTEVVFKVELLDIFLKNY